MIRLLEPQKLIAAKMVAMREAVYDPLFLADIKEVMEDFAYADAIEKLTHPKGVLQ